MSLYSALYAGVSGLGAQSSAMATVADNITNINTVGYKGTEADFRSLVTDGRLKSSYSAGGVAAAPRAMISKQGLLQASGSQTDLGIDGGGFFVTRKGDDVDSGVAFTRAGAFRPDEQGYLRNTSGYYLQGWRLDSAGSFTSTGALTELEPVRLSGLTGTAAATTRLQVRANLQSTQEPFTGAYAAGDMATGALEPHFSRTFEIYDAQGGGHQVTMGFVKTAPNQWVAEIYGDPADVTAANGLLASGTVAFNPDGSLDLANSSPALFDTLNVAWTNQAGSSPIKLNLGSQDGLDGLTQFGSASALIASSTDGGMLNNLVSVEVSKEGIVSAIFDDGTARAVFQLPMATFANPDGLTRLPGNAYGVSQQSGNVAIGRPGELGSGTIASGTLEASNVDLAQEFTNMIRFQRAYSASSKIITTVDDMLQEVSALKR
ncbi:flagellar hook protein FlgE [Pseudoblastomonas halimionae]|uniref:Flagellar hook protein FlgE n=1 Tax=Alteriqipengyuania halimionae TaxID=1926630 RepID=A0A6I4U3V5_9SPHN|nr:flagellar hook protein FlgE [Alteriqipengyuania halimionae]MXP10416.1 flagellar hook-basal body complex protein [Alteriqipengyuania halimionae]